MTIYRALDPRVYSIRVVVVYFQSAAHLWWKCYAIAHSWARDDSSLWEGQQARMVAPIEQILPTGSEPVHELKASTDILLNSRVSGAMSK